MGGTATGVRDGVVDIAERRRLITTRRPAGQIPAPHKLGEFGRRDVSRFRLRIAGVNQRLQCGGLGQLGDDVGRYQPAGARDAAQACSISAADSVVVDNSVISNACSILACRSGTRAPRSNN